MRAHNKSMVERTPAVGFAAVEAALVVAVAERAVIWATAQASSDIGAVAFLTWLGANAAAALLLGLAAMVALAFKDLVEQKRGEGRVATAAGAVFFGVIAGIAAAPLGSELTSGGWISQQSWGWLVGFVPAVAAATTATAVWALKFGSAAFLRSIALAGSFAAGLGLIVVDHLILPGTYPDLHLLIWGVAVLFVLMPVLPPSGPRGKIGRGAGLVLVALCLGGAAAWLFSPMQVRAELTMGSPMAANLARATLPPVEFDFAERELAALDPNEGSFLRADSVKLDRTDWNVLWITVDTLRADVLPPARTKKVKFVAPSDTPFLNRWLADSTTFETVYAQSSATHRSMPPMFRSLQAHEDALTIGEPLGAAMAATGRTSAAVVNNFFLEPRYKTSQSLLWGFDLVSVHEKARQDMIVEQLAETVERTRDDGFFIWMHFYNMHAPGYDGEMLKGVGIHSAYKRSLQWLDARMKEVVETLEQQGVADNTIVIFSADHGESLGANRIKNHGPTVYEEEVRVPLAIRVPGVEPRQVAGTVGNVDIVPTIWDALGLSPSPTHRGRSLIPAVLGQPLEAEPYYMENHNGTKKAVVLERQKLIFDVRSNTFFRFDLAIDPKEDENLFKESDADRPLLAALYQKNPELVQRTKVIGNLAAQKLGEVDPTSPGSNLEYLVALGSRAKVSATGSRLRELFEKTPHDEVKLAALAGLNVVEPDEARELVEAFIPRLGAEDERRFVDGLADIGLQQIDIEIVAAQMTVAGVDDATLRAWLRWVERWGKAPVGAVLAEVATRVEGYPEALTPATIALLSSVIGKADLGAHDERLTAFNRSLLKHEAARVRYAAVQTAASLGDKASLPRLYELGVSPEVRDRQATIHALAELEGGDAVERIVAIAKDPNLILDAIKALEKTGSEAALPFLRDVAENHFNWIIQDHAKRAIKRID